MRYCWRKVILQIAGLIFLFSYIYNLESRWWLSASLISLIFLIAIFTLSSNTIWNDFFSYFKAAAFTVAPLLVIATYSFAVAFVYQGDAYILGISLLKTALYALIFAFFFHRFLSEYVRDSLSTQDLVLYLVAVTFVQSIFIVISFFSSDFVHLVNSYLDVKGNLAGTEGFRVKGLANSGGANMSLAHGIVAGIGIVYFWSCKNWLGMLMAMVVLAASTLVGRSGLVVFLSIILASLIVADVRAKLAIVGALVVLFLCALFAIDLFEGSRWYRWFYLDASTSLNDLYGMLSLPQGISLLIGNGYFEDTPLGIPRTDSGIFKAIYVLGVPLMFLFYLYLIKLLSFVVEYSLKISKGMKLYVIVFMAVVLMLIEIKEAAIYQNMTGRILFFCVFFLLADRIRRQEQSLTFTNSSKGAS